jgi:DNA invertase Pin-like site-specific DNA recombinase
MKIGYARVSTEYQSLALQLHALRAAGCEVVHEDKASGVLTVRKGLADALRAALPVMCWWCGNSTGWRGRFTISL